MSHPGSITLQAERSCNKKFNVVNFLFKSLGLSSFGIEAVSLLMPPVACMSQQETDPDHLDESLSR